MELGFELSEFDKHIYNTHLRISRTQQKQPFKYRKDFSKIDDQVKIYLKKLSKFFAKFDHIKVEDFILAPYDVYKDETFFDLKFYTGLKAIKTYTIFQKNKMYEDPDTNYHLTNIIESLNFISKYCTENNLLLSDYLNYKQNNITPQFLVHLKEHRTNVYTLLGFKNFLKTIRAFDAELVKFIIGEELYNRLEVCQTKLLSSKKAIHVISKGLTIIEKKLQQKR